MKQSACKYWHKVTLVTMCFISLFISISPGKVFAEENGVVLGDATTFTDSQRNLLIAKPAVVQITNIVTGQMTIQSTLASALGAPSMAGMYYEFGIGLGGSGFFVTDDGYLLTNGHVADPEDDLVAYYALAQLYESIYRDAIIVMWESSYGYTPSESEVADTFDYILWQSYGGDTDAMIIDLYATNYKGGDLKMDNVKNNNYIQTGAVSGTEKVVKELGKAANLVDTLYDGDFDSNDIALLKVEGSNFPTVEMGSFQNVQIGSELYVVGYPAVVEVATGYFTDVESELEPSITKGIVSAKKKLVDGTEAFQTDADISGGNSGGPALDETGKVIGMATWSIGDYEGGESYNFLISVESLETILTRNNVTAEKSLTTQKWEEALGEYENKCYTKAKKIFEETQDLYGDNVDIEEFITKCQTAIENGEDECLSEIKPWMIIAGASCCLLMTGAFVVVILFVVIKKKKRTNNKTEKKE